MRWVEDITQSLCGTRVSSGTVSKLNGRIYKHIERWRTRPIEQPFLSVYFDGLVMNKTWAGKVQNVSVLVAIGVGEYGHMHVLGVDQDSSKTRGLTRTRLFISDTCIGLVGSITDIYADTDWQWIC